MKAAAPIAAAIFLAALPAHAETQPRPGDILTGSMVVFSPVQQPLGATEWSLGLGYSPITLKGNVAPPFFPVLGVVSRITENLEVSALISPNSILGFRVPHVQEADRAVGSGFELQAQLDPRIDPSVAGTAIPSLGTQNFGAQYVLETYQKVGPFGFYAMPQFGYYTKGPIAGIGFDADLELGPVILGAGVNLRYWYKTPSFVPDSRLGVGARYVVDEHMFLMAAFNGYVPEGIQAYLMGAGYRFGDVKRPVTR